MVTAKTIREIKTNFNTGVEYEIALFRCLLLNDSEIRQVDAAIKKRCDARAIESIIKRTSTASIMRELKKRFLTMIDVSFETQNDDVGPADVVMIVKSTAGMAEQLGISVKYANACTLNITGRKFLTDLQISKLEQQLEKYTDEFISEMKRLYGNATNWFRTRKSCTVTDKFIDLIRDEVISNWSMKTDADKESILMAAYQEISPIPYWVFTYTRSASELDTDPYKITPEKVPQVKLRKHEKSYVGFYLDEKLIGKMQVKFNNGFVEKCKKIHPDRIVDGVRMALGRPFSSWNFNLVHGQ